MPRSTDKRYWCPVELTLDVMGGKWKPLILWLLRAERRRYNDLQAAMPGITHKVLTHQLRELERDGIVTRIVTSEPHLRVEYAVSDFGATLRPVLDGMASWGKRHHRRFGATILPTP
jgi:DNA-binding HxlR family transcriptional regulator